MNNYDDAMRFDPDMTEGPLDWDDTITEDDSYILIEPGVYQFKVNSFERGRTKGSDKLPPSNMAKLTLEILLPDNSTVQVFSNLVLHSKMEWQLSQFFTAIGQKKKDQPLRMNWQQVVGAKGLCEIDHRIYEGNAYNNVKKFLPPKEDHGKSEWQAGNF